MPPPVILEPSALELNHVLVARDEIAALNPQRHEFALLDAIVYMDLDRAVFAGYHDIRPDAWWTRAHIPGRPLFPGVLMIEAAAQLASYMHKRVLKTEGFLGFAGVDGVKFRGAVVPPARFLIIAHATSIKPRRTICQAQGFVDGSMVFEGEITGMPV